ncbi:aminotransferase class I/II-fold pyridoxal phosphate-dependent enzyme [Nubsella zeaxanthinifaciens]|uniref:aminotransferase class I/II-fold pyridoxal phosphate-dependent enzyme n=1 Tax=Nubsella zeaxanthinifaciens TaxID=392412 RepID=UPI000DE431AD|nr:aminotransferase class I/II-fold pyridoxal phosphate-dependent enzyme [Nubsella zeaxanthinifaciens]
MQNGFSKLDQPLSSSLLLNGQKYLYFGGTAYLGIPQNKTFLNFYLKGIERYGLNNGTSRGNNVQLGIYDEAEAFVADRFGAAAALITSSGYLAAQLTVSALAKQRKVSYAPDTHPALWMDENPMQHQTFEQWSKAIVSEINQSENEHWLLLSNSVNNLFPEIYNFDFIQQIHPSKNVILIIDDSHGVGLLNGGNSVLSSIPATANVEVVVVASMAKALGIDAGVVFGSAKAVNSLKLSNEFYGASPPAAAGLYAFIHAQEVYQQAFQQLQENIQLFTQQLNNLSSWGYVNQFPVFLSKEPAIEKRLMQEKILISSFPYPDQYGAPLNRVVISSWHSKADILELTKALEA